MDIEKLPPNVVKKYSHIVQDSSLKSVKKTEQKSAKVVTKVEEVSESPPNKKQKLLDDQVVPNFPENLPPDTSTSCVIESNDKLR